jgi:hypothetical protein
VDGSLVSLLQKDEIVRKVTQVFCLERLASGDTITARTLLANIVAVKPFDACPIKSLFLPFFQKY